MNLKEAVQKIKTEYNIVDYIKTNGVELKSAGNNIYKGLCPFHNEKTPSFTVSEDFQNYRCFGCGASGDILSFAQHTHTVSFVEAAKMLAEEKGYKLDEKTTEEDSKDINGIRKVVEDAALFYRESFKKLSENHPSKQEIIKRGISVNNPLYGYANDKPNDLYKFLKSKGHPDKNIKESNLVIFYDEPNRQPWDFFHGRLTITLSDYLGRPVSFTARKIYEDDKMAGKYVNGKESPVFHKKNNLFGAHIAKNLARNTGVVYVVEGQFDQLTMVENGIENVVATSGTAFTDEHANLLLRMVGDSGKIVFIMDGDKAGVEAAVKVFTNAKSLHTSSFAVMLKDGMDPCDYIMKSGIDSLKEEIKKAVPLHDFVVDATLKAVGGTINMNNRQKFVALVCKFAKSSDSSYIVDSMLSKASILSAISISNVKEIYKNFDTSKPQVKREKPREDKPKLNPMIKLDMKNEADLCMFSALAMLVRVPETLVPITPKEIHKKFRPFMKELGVRYVRSKKQGTPWRFIAEEYTDSDFAKALQNKEFLEDPREDLKAAASQYKYLFDRANLIYRQDYERIKKAKAMSSLIDSNSPEEIAQALKVYKESHN